MQPGDAGSIVISSNAVSWELELSRSTSTGRRLCGHVDRRPQPRFPFRIAGTHRQIVQVRLYPLIAPDGMIPTLS